MKYSNKKTIRFLHLIMFCLLFFVTAEVSSQKKKTKRPSKKERKLQKFELQKQAMIDTSFVIYTNRIRAPYVLTSSVTGGILRVEKNEVFIDEIDWVDERSSKVRIHEIGKPTNYTFIEDEENSKRVSFEANVKGEIYFLNVMSSFEKGVELEIKNSKGRKVIYEGKIKVINK